MCCFGAGLGKSAMQAHGIGRLGFRDRANNSRITHSFYAARGPSAVGPTAVKLG